MNDRSNWTADELAMQKALDRVREKYPDFWKELLSFPAESKKIRNNNNQADKQLDYKKEDSI